MTGLLLIPWPLATLFAAPVAGYLVERIHPGILGSIGMGIFCIRLRLILCGIGFGLFQTPNSSLRLSQASVLKE